MDKHLMVVILGAPSGRERSERAANLFERYFSNPGSSEGDVASLPPSEIVLPPDMRGQVCGPGRANALAEAEAEDASIPLAPSSGPMFSRPAERADVVNMAAAQLAGVSGAAQTLLGPRAAFTPVRVFVGPAPGWNGTVAGPIEASAPGPKTPQPPAVPSLAAKAGPSPDTSAADAASAPMALAGAVAPPPALAAANRVVKPKGRLSLRVPGGATVTKAAARGARTANVKAASALGKSAAAGSDKGKRKGKPAKRKAAAR